jgi:hypothetical protein
MAEPRLTAFSEALVERAHWAAATLLSASCPILRGVEFEGEQTVLIPSPRRAGQIEEHREITCERIAGT